MRIAILDLRFRDALEAVWEMVTALNRAVEERKPWALEKECRAEELDALLYELCEGLRRLAILLHPVCPERMEELWRRLGAGGEIGAPWTQSLVAGAGIAPSTRTSLGEPLFPRIELAPK